MLTDQALRTIDPAFYKDKTLDRDAIQEFFDSCQVSWVHNGDPKIPHAELTTGDCSNGYFDLSRMLKYPAVSKVFAYQLVKKIHAAEFLMPIDWVIGSPYSAITFSYDVAYLLQAKHAFAQKDSKDPTRKAMVYKAEPIKPTETVLRIEELITTNNTFMLVNNAMADAQENPINFLPIVGCIVHRPKKMTEHYGKFKVISLFDQEVWAVKPEECHLCRAGSKRIKPRGNWNELTKKAQ